MNDWRKGGFKKQMDGMAKVFNQYQLPKSELSNKTTNIISYLRFCHL